MFVRCLWGEPNAKTVKNKQLTFNDHRILSFFASKIIDMLNVYCLFLTFFWFRIKNVKRFFATMDMNEFSA